MPLSLLKPYKSLQGYLHRFTVLHLGPLHIRIHRIHSEDKTPFLHTHPFAYLSIVLWGGYEELIEKQGELVANKRRIFSLVARSSRHAHQILNVKPGTTTLFATFGLRHWRWHFTRRGRAHSQWQSRPRGVYLRVLSGEPRFCKFDQFWHKSAPSIELAEKEILPSLNQSAPCGPVLKRL